MDMCVFGRMLLAIAVHLSDNSSRGLYSLETYVILLPKYVLSPNESLTSYQRDVVCYG